MKNSFYHKLNPFIQSHIPILWITGLMLLVTITNLSVSNKSHAWGDDFAMYLSQMQSLSDGTLNQLEEQQKFLEANTSVIIGPMWYPWGYPIVLIPIYKLFGMDIEVFKFYTFLFFVFSLPLFFYFLKIILPKNSP